MKHLNIRQVEAEARVVQAARVLKALDFCINTTFSHEYQEASRLLHRAIDHLFEIDHPPLVDEDGALVQRDHIPVDGMRLLARLKAVYAEDDLALARGALEAGDTRDAVIKRNKKANESRGEK